MKKSVLAIAVAAAAMVASSAVSAAQVYNKDGVTLDVGGRVEALVMDGAKTNTHDTTIRDRMRLNVKGTSKLTDWATAYGFWETQQQHQNTSVEGAASSLRYAYVGVDFGKFGRVQSGRFEDALEWASDVTDKLEEDGCNALVGDDRNSGKLMYVWEGYGVHFGVNYQTAVNGYGLDLQDVVGIGNADVNKGFSAALGYTSPVVLFGPISIRTGYSYVDYQEAEAVADNSKIWTVGLSWGTHKKGFYVATDYTYGKLSVKDVAGAVDGKVKAVEFLVSYGFESGVVLNAAYSYRDITTVRNAEGKMKLVSVTAAYNINPNFRVWAEAHFDASSDKGFGKYSYNNDEHNCYMIGARYTF